MSPWFVRTAKSFSLCSVLELTKLATATFRTREPSRAVSFNFSLETTLGKVKTCQHEQILSFPSLVEELHQSLCQSTCNEKSAAFPSFTSKRGFSASSYRKQWMNFCMAMIWLSPLANIFLHTKSENGVHFVAGRTPEYCLQFEPDLASF